MNFKEENLKNFQLLQFKLIKLTKNIAILNNLYWLMWHEVCSYDKQDATYICERRHSRIFLQFKIATLLKYNNPIDNLGQQLSKNFESCSYNDPIANIIVASHLDAVYLIYVRSRIFQTL